MPLVNKNCQLGVCVLIHTINHGWAHVRDMSLLEVRSQQAKMMHEVLGAFHVRDSGSWVSKSCVLEGGRWARAHKDQLELLFPKRAVGKASESELSSVRDAATFLRQFLRYHGEYLRNARKSNAGKVETMYCRA